MGGYPLTRRVQDRAHEPVDERVDALVARACMQGVWIHRQGQPRLRDPVTVARAMALDRGRTLRGALAGGVAAGAWAAQQPLDKRLFGSDYDDMELLGKAVTRGSGWFPTGLALHLTHGALFGAVYANVARLAPLPPTTRGPLAGLTEHVGLWPLARLSDRFHPARDELPRLTGNGRAFAQATWRHLLFGVVLGELERRINPPAPEPPTYDYAASTNGHGSLEHAFAGEGSS